MNSHEIRDAFLRFFEDRGHVVLPSSSLVPHGDPTLLLTSAGMVQMKPFFVGEATPPSPRLASCQKCFRTTDIDSVGDAGHLTFFEMLGNFSAGDYFKQESIEWAWEFVTRDLNLPPERLWITVFLDDDEAERYWLGLGVPPERIVRCGEEDNFWGPAGETGPCGPCSEIHYDFGEGTGCGSPECDPSCGCDRFLEIWNLVFTEFDQDAGGARRPLKQKNIDTGMGLERTATIMQGRQTLYETDLFTPLMDRLTELSGHRYGESGEITRAMRVAAEHARAVTFLIADGVIPSNDGRGYVLRRVLRRAALFGRKLGLNEAFLKEIAVVVIEEMGSIYPELVRNRDYVLNTIGIEEEKFDQTLNTGMNLLDEIVDEVKSGGDGVIPGEQVFRLYDTYGFPKEITAEIAAENGLGIDLEGFEREMAAQRDRAREAHKFGLADRSTEQFYEGLGLAATEFVGYESFSAEARLIGLISDGQMVEEAVGGSEVEIVLSRTSFYAEMGGQVGDTGEIVGENGRIVVTGTHKPVGDLVVHSGRVEEGAVKVNDRVETRVDGERRLDIARNHTATHLLHQALRHVLGGQVQQGGSLVAPDHFRFDFTHLVSLSRDEMDQVSHLVNENIRRNLPVTGRVLPYRQALEAGALAFFGEKYGDEVRMVEIGGADPGERVSAELCGGTHLDNTGEIGFFHIISEKSIGSGLRRIEAVTGRGAESLIERRFSLLENLADRLESGISEAGERLEAVLAELSAARKRARDLESKMLKGTAESLLARVAQVNGVNVLAAEVPASNMEAIRDMGDWLKRQLGSAVIVLGVVLDGNPRFLAMVTPDLVSRGIHAGNIVREVAKVTGGGGGGKPEMAQAGGKDRGRMDEALRLVPSLVEKT